MRTYTTIILGSTGVVIPGLNPAFSSQGSSAMASITTATTGFQKIEFCNGFALQLNVALGTSGGSAPTGTIAVQASCDGINFSTMPTGYNGSTAIVISSSGTTMMMNYPNPNFNYLRANFTASSTSANGIYNLVMNSKTFS